MRDTHQELESMRSAGAWRIWEPLYQTRDWCRGYGFHIALMFIVAVFGLGGYETTLLFAAERGLTSWDPSSSWDHSVPALPWTVIIYLTLYLYSPLPIFAAKRDERGRRELAFLAQGMLLLFTISFAFFLLMPAQILVRPQMEMLVSSMRPLYKDIFEVIYILDRPFNSWPSLHVSQSLLIVLFCHRWLELRADEFPRRGVWMTGLWLAWVALSLSILTTKQHFIWDMVTGAVLGALLWWFYILPRLEQRIVSRQAASLPTSA
jgi:membrane-associated phospholipid phosphatase